MLPRLAPLAVVVLLAGCGGGSGSPPVHHSLFGYERGAPLRFQDHGRVNRNYPIQVRDVSYADPRGGVVKGYLVLPPGKGPFPAVVYLHGSGEDRTRLLVPAAWLAARGAVGLTIDSAFVRTRGPGPPGAIRRLDRVRNLTAKTIVDLRRGVDVLQSLPQVDPKRIGFVGFSSGAKIGAILAGVDHRIRAFDLRSGGSPTPESYAALAPPSIRGSVERVLSQIDPLIYVRHTAPSALFFQDGREDTVVPRADLIALERAGSRPKLVRWYAANHSLNAQADRDALAWLSKELGIHGPPVPGAQTGP